MSPKLACFAIVALSSSAGASLTVFVDQLGPEDGVTNLPPESVICVDVFVDVFQGDCWTAGALRATTQHGATLRYATDPNTAVIELTNPGTDDRFVTFFNEPRARDANIRYNNGGAAVAGRYSPTGPTPTSTATEVNVAYYASPPETIGSPTVDGAVFRVAIDLPPGSTADQFHTIVSSMPAPGDAILVCEGGQPADIGLGTVHTGFDPQLSGLSWYVAPIPEPNSLMLLAIAGAWGLVRCFDMRPFTFARTDERNPRSRRSR